MKIGIKIGTERFTDLAVVGRMVSDISGLMREGVGVTLVSSGAVQMGREVVGVSKELDETLDQKRFFASLGQPKLISFYSSLFARFGIKVGQILCSTHEMQKSGDEIGKVIEWYEKEGMVPIINDNDVVSRSPIEAVQSIGDNDDLAVATAQTLLQKELVFITASNGIWDKNPQISSAQRIPHITSAHKMQDLFALTGGSALGNVGGIASKVRAACTAALSGIKVHVCDGVTSTVTSHIRRTNLGGTVIEFL